MRNFKAFTVIIHIAGWALFMAFPLVFLSEGPQSVNTLQLLHTTPYWVFCLTYIFLFYLNTRFIIPRFFLKKHYLDYAIIALVLFSCVYFLKPFDRLLRSSWDGNEHTEQHMGPPPPPDGHRQPQFDDHRPGFRNDDHGPGGPPHGPRQHRIDVTSLFLFLMIMALSTATKTVEQWQLTEQRATRAEADKASAELSFLKAQINPHFLFNTLNNIYTLAVTKNEYTADSIMKLSNIMRYVTDDVTEDFVPLQSEIDCIADYIELQRLRTGKNTKIEFAVTGNMAFKRIPPLVMMTFVENVFKYGISKHEPSFVNISIDMDDNQIHFFCQNQVFAARAESSRTGIGIKNTKQRLDHLYADKYFLDISNDGQLYTVLLILQT
ncbi:MAG TPA: sensor histidine kinase [Mucilaginibacter sp.]|jgi:hypothetical protein|nr:sensor histidine kinase [Mucilaginibacter sp.]